MTAWQGAFQAHLALRLRVAQQKVVHQPEPLAGVRQIQPVSAPKALQNVVSQERLRAVRPVTADESV